MSILKALFILSAAALILLWLTLRPSREVSVTFLSVGQGDCTVFRIEDYTIVVDAGPKTQSFDAGDRIVLPKLRAMGVTRIDLLLLTHPDSDHIGGARKLLQAFPSARVAMSKEFARSPALVQAIRSWEIQPDQVVWLEERGSIRAGRFTMRFWCPKMIPGAEDNDGSVFVRAVLDQGEVVMSGDAPTYVEQSAAHADDWAGDVLKLGHHGSRTASSDDWLDEVDPAMAVASCGRENAYGHPHSEVVKKLGERRVELLRTDMSGDIRFVWLRGNLRRD